MPAVLRRPPVLGAPVPTPGPDVCTRCSGPARHGPGECWCCRRVGQALGEAPGAGPPVLPIALCCPGDLLHGLLRRYKDAPVAEARRHRVAVLGRMLDGYLLRAARQVVATPWEGFDAVAAVPSSSRAAIAGREACPLAAVMAASRVLGGLPRVTLARGPGDCGHLRPSARAFVPSGPVAGRRLLVVEDTWVTGARARSAAAALALAGAEVLAVIVVGRAVDPDASPAVRAWWERHCTPGSCAPAAAADLRGAGGSGDTCLYQAD